jgi:hypothetical protein
MKNNFTTPSFAKVLKEHGIEIYSCFVTLMFDDENYTLALKSNEGSCIDINGYKHWLSDFSDVFPAYPLTEALGWLPKTLIEHLKPTNTPSHRPDYLSYPITSDIDDNNVLKIGYKSEYYGTKITPQNIEALILQGLTEGWLTKNNLNLAK